MCMRAETEKCELNEAVSDLASRMDKVEARLDTIESASIFTRDSINAVNANIETLSQMMANMDSRLVEEKVKWGEVFRKLVGWTVKALLITALGAAGVNLAETFIK